MKPSLALGLAVASAALAVAIVAADLQYTFVLRVDGRSDDGGWETVAVAPYDEATLRDPFGDDGCATPEFRVVLDNARPMPARPDVTVRYYNASSQRQETLYDERVSLAAFEQRLLEFTVPSEAFPTASDDTVRPPDKMAQVTVVAGDLSVHVCVREEAST